MKEYKNEFYQCALRYFFIITTTEPMAEFFNFIFQLFSVIFKTKNKYIAIFKGLVSSTNVHANLML